MPRKSWYFLLGEPFFMNANIINKMLDISNIVNKMLDIPCGFKLSEGLTVVTYRQAHNNIDMT